MPRYTKSVSLLLFLASVASVSPSYADEYYPVGADNSARHAFTIEMSKAYVSGILILRNVEPNIVRGSLVNEFGISLLDFSYNEKERKVKLEHVMKMLDKWYIKRTLRNDLRESLEAMRRREEEYVDKRHDIKYTFKPFAETSPDLPCPEEEDEP